MIKKVLLIIIAILLGVTAWYVSHPKPKPPVTRAKPVPAHITHGIRAPYEECRPAEFGRVERRHQQEISDLAVAMAKYNNVPHAIDNPAYQQIKQVRDQLVAEYDNCALIIN